MFQVQGETILEPWKVASKTASCKTYDQCIYKVSVPWQPNCRRTVSLITNILNTNRPTQRWMDRQADSSLPPICFAGVWKCSSSTENTPCSCNSIIFEIASMTLTLDPCLSSSLHRCKQTSFSSNKELFSLQVKFVTDGQTNKETDRQTLNDMPLIFPCSHKNIYNIYNLPISEVCRVGLTGLLVAISFFHWVRGDGGRPQARLKKNSDLEWLIYVFAAGWASKRKSHISIMRW